MSQDNFSKRILCVGMCVLDIVHVCEQYPEEDSDRRCLRGYWQRGGNASNICTVLSNLNANCEFMGMISTNPAFQFLLNDCERYGIKINNCPTTEQMPPFSSVILVESKDSRTIVHSNNNFPILTYKHFKQLNLDDYSWIHFEARNPDETILMMKEIRDFNNYKRLEGKRIIISIELEKKREENLVLAELADYIFLGKDLAKHLGWNDGEIAVYALREKLLKLKNNNKSVIICTWGSAGCCFLNEYNKYEHKNAASPSRIVDSLGAGDVFCAVTIWKLNQGTCLEEAVDAANEAAGYKLSFYGYDNLKNINLTNVSN